MLFSHGFSRRIGKSATFFLVVFSLLTHALPSFAQEGTSVLRGIVLDSTGAVIPNAQVSIANQATWLNRRTATTNDSGIYVFPSLIPGRCRITVEAQGFKTAMRKDVGLEVGEASDAF
ncbi:MAG: carboxypeptidase-like regulatory domain-containing protein [Blastocatellia bacterium]